MMKHEFEKRIGGEVYQKEYDIIETVYNYYDEKLDKDFTAQLYKNFGIKIFNDMLPRAIRIKEIEENIKFYDQKKRELMNEMINLKNPSIP